MSRFTSGLHFFHPFCSVGCSWDRSVAGFSRSGARNHDEGAGCAHGRRRFASRAQWRKWTLLAAWCQASKSSASKSSGAGYPTHIALAAVLRCMLSIRTPLDEVPGCRRAVDTFDS